MQTGNVPKIILRNESSEGQKFISCIRKVHEIIV
jgi:hypothetical protein